jgi:PIN domain nuclease of toxin-antitoxin system
MRPDKVRGPGFDASAVLALMQGEPGADKLRDFQAHAVVNAVNAAEVLAKLVRRGMPVADARAACEALHLETTPFDTALVTSSARFVHRGVSLGDRCFLASAQRHGSGWTSDHDLGTIFGSRVPALNFFR